MFKQLVLALAFAPLGAQASGLPDYPFIHATGEAFVMLAPDIGEIDFDISAHDDDPAIAVATLAERAGQVRALLTDGDTSIDIRDVRKDLRKQADAAAAPQYDIRSAVHIVVRNLGNWRPIMQGLLALPDIDRLATTFARSDREQAERELAAAAVKDGLRRANDMAAGFGRKAGAVTAISSGQLRNLTGAVGLMPGDSYRNNRMVNAPADDKDFLAVDVLRWSQTVDMVVRIK